MILPNSSALFREGAWVSQVDLRMPHDGDRVDLGREFDELTLKYGAPGVIRGYDARGLAFMEVRQLDFGVLPLTGVSPPWMNPEDYKTLMRLTHTPEYVMLHACGGKYSKPTTGKWIRLNEDRREFNRLSWMTILGEVHRQ